MANPWELNWDSPHVDTQPTDEPAQPDSAPWLMYPDQPNLDPKPTGDGRFFPPGQARDVLDYTADLPSTLYRWAKDNPQDVADLLTQMVTTTMGTAAGAPAGPLGMMAGGAAGNVAGKQIARRLFGMGEPAPDLMSGETAIDAAAGGVGPLLGTGARAASRLVTGLDRAPVREAVQAAFKNEDDLLARVAARKEKVDALLDSAEVRDAIKVAEGQLDPERLKYSVPNRAKARAEMQAKLDKEAASYAEDAPAFIKLKTDQAIDKAIEAAKQKASDKATSSAVGDVASRSIPGAMLGGAIGYNQSLDLAVSTLIGAGASAELIRKTVPKILASDKAKPFLEWALHLDPKRVRPGEVFTSLQTMAQANAIEASGRPEPQAKPEPPKAEIPRDVRGRFVARYGAEAQALRALRGEQQ